MNLGCSAGKQRTFWICERQKEGWTEWKDFCWGCTLIADVQFDAHPHCHHRMENWIIIHWLPAWISIIPLIGFAKIKTVEFFVTFLHCNFCWAKRCLSVDPSISCESPPSCFSTFWSVGPDFACSCFHYYLHFKPVMKRAKYPVYLLRGLQWPILITSNYQVPFDRQRTFSQAFVYMKYMVLAPMYL